MKKLLLHCRVLRAGCILCLTLLLLSPQATEGDNESGDRWVYINSIDGGTLFADKQGVRLVNEDIVEFWVRLIYTKEEINKMIEDKKRSDFLCREVSQLKSEFGLKVDVSSHCKNRYTKDWDRLSYVLSLWRVNINHRTFTITSIINYTSDGKALSSEQHSGEYQPIVPGTIGEDMYNFAIKYAGKK